MLPVNGQTSFDRFKGTLDNLSDKSSLYNYKIKDGKLKKRYELFDSTKKQNECIQKLGNNIFKQLEQDLYAEFKNSNFNIDESIEKNLKLNLAQMNVVIRLRKHHIPLDKSDLSKDQICSEKISSYMDRLIKLHSNLDNITAFKENFYIALKDDVIRACIKKCCLEKKCYIDENFQFLDELANFKKLDNKKLSEIGPSIFSRYMEEGAEDQVNLFALTKKNIAQKFLTPNGVTANIFDEAETEISKILWDNLHPTLIRDLKSQFFT